jgi:hypothetical protein
MRLTQSVRRLINEQHHDEILREAFLYDVRRLEEARAIAGNLLKEGVICEKLTDAMLLDESIFAAIKGLDKVKSATPTTTNRIIEASAPATSTTAQAAVNTILTKVAKDDPTQYAKLKAAAEEDPKKIQSILTNFQSHPTVDPQAVKASIAQTPSADGKPSLLGKLGAWTKKNPIKAGLALTALATIGTAVGIGTVGIGPLVAAALVGGAKGAAIGGAIGGTMSGVKTAIASKKADGKVDWKQTGKEALTGAKKGAVKGAVTGALGGAFAKAAGSLAHAASAATSTQQVAMNTELAKLMSTQHQLGTGAIEGPSAVDTSTQISQAAKNAASAIQNQIDALIAKGANVKAARKMLAAVPNKAQIASKLADINL